MANRIQLRRDTAANWTRVNPVLEDGEPGLEIETNRVKYGDGNTTWANLSYSGGGSVSFDYSTVQEGSDGPNDITSITGGDDTGVSLTSENWAQLMWVPDTATVTIADIGDGPATYTWAFVDDEGFHVAASVDEVNRDWRFTTNGNLELPLGGKIGEVPSPTFVGNAVVITPADGTDDNQQLMIYPTQNEGNHLHMTSGNLAVTDIFLGDDYQYIRTRTDQGMTIGTGGGEMWSGNAWTFGANGILSTPGNVQVGSVGTYGNISFVNTIRANNYAYANGVSILSGIGGGTYGNTEVAAYLAGNVTTGNLTVGNLIVTGNSTVINVESYVVADNIIQMANANPADTLDLGFIAHRTVNSTLEHTGLVRDASTNKWYLFSNVIPQPGNTVDLTNAIDDNLQVGNVTARSLSMPNGYLNFSVNSAATLNGITFSDGTVQTTASTGGGSITVDNFTGNGSQTSYTLSVVPLGIEYTMVSLAGTLQPRTVYSLTTNVLTFSSAPPSGAVIEVTILSSGVVNTETITITNTNITTTSVNVGNLTATSITANNIVTDTLVADIVAEGINLTVDTLTANSVINGGSGTPTLQSDTSIELSAATVVRVPTSPLQFYNCTSTVRDAIAASNGYVIYNTTSHKLQVYANGSWVDLH